MKVTDKNEALLHYALQELNLLELELGEQFQARLCELARLILSREHTAGRDHFFTRSVLYSIDKGWLFDDRCTSDLHDKADVILHPSTQDKVRRCFVRELAVVVLSSRHQDVF